MSKPNTYTAWNPPAPKSDETIPDVSNPKLDALNRKLNKQNEERMDIIRNKLRAVAASALSQVRQTNAEKLEARRAATNSMIKHAAACRVYREAVRAIMQFDGPEAGEA
jgi:hypothetical protein